MGLVGEEVYGEIRKDDWEVGQILLVGTDGLWESQDADGEVYGKERLKRVIRDHADKRADEIATQITADLRRFRGAARQDDDITCVLVKFTGN